MSINATYNIVRKIIACFEPFSSIISRTSVGANLTGYITMPVTSTNIYAVIVSKKSSGYLTTVVWFFS